MRRYVPAYKGLFEWGFMVLYLVSQDPILFVDPKRTSVENTTAFPTPKLKRLSA